MTFFFLAFFNVVLQVFLYLFYIGDFFTLSNSIASFWDYIIFASYVFTLFFFLRMILIAPIVFILGKLHVLLYRIVFVILETFLIMFVLIDSKVYLNQGLHLYDKIILSALSNPDINHEIQFGFMAFFSVVLVVVVLIVFEFWLWGITRRLVVSIVKKVPVLFILSVVMVAGIITFWSTIFYIPQRGEVANIYPFYAPLKGKPSQDPLKVIYQYPKEGEIKIGTKKHVIIIMAESLRSDAFTEELMPNLFNMSREYGCLTSKRHFSGGHSTEYGIFTALYGLHGYHYNDFRDQGDYPSLALKVLKENGYSIVGASSSQVASWNGGEFMFEIFDEYREFRDGNVIEDDSKTMEWVLHRTVSKKEHPQFHFIFFNTTHHNYYYPPSFERFKPTIKVEYNIFQNAEHTRKNMHKIINRYKNSVFYLDHIVDDYIKKSIDKLGKNTIIVFTGDHAEEFGDHGLFGHAKTSYINARIQVPFLICDFSKKLPAVDFSSHVDIVPTILDLMEVNGLDITRVFNGRSLLKISPTDKRYTVVTGTQFPYGRHRIGLIDNKYKFWFKKISSKIHHLYKYRSTTLEDKPVLDGSDKEAMIQIMQKFSNDVYLFLAPK